MSRHCARDDDLGAVLAPAEKLRRNSIGVGQDSAPAPKATLARLTDHQP